MKEFKEYKDDFLVLSEQKSMVLEDKVLIPLRTLESLKCHSRGQLSNLHKV